MKRGFWRIAAAALALAAGISAAAAQSCNATVTNPIQLGGAGGPDILSGAAVDLTATVAVTCTGVLGLTQVCVSIDAGTGGASGSTYRLMSDGAGHTVQYQLFQDSGHATPWGSVVTPSLGTVPPIGVIIVLGGTTVNTSLYARLLGSQTGTIPANFTSTLATQLNYGPLSILTGCTGLLTKNNAGASFDVKTNVQKNCLLTVSQNLDFGSVSVLAANIDKQGTLSVNCTNGTTYNIALDLGTGSGATLAARKMTKVGGGATINYGLYQNSGRSTQWGSTIGTNALAGTGTGTAAAIPVYGRVPPQTTPAAADYKDTVIVTLTY